MRSFSDKTPVSAQVAVTQFLSDMTVVARKTYPIWFDRLQAGYVDCFPDRRETAKENLGKYPLEDFYFAGVVAQEASKIRRNLPANEASAALAALADTVDQVGGRPDRVISDMVFFFIGRIDLETGVEQMKTPYDLIVKMLLTKIGVGSDGATKPLMDDIMFRHNLGEPLARGVPAWWNAFSASFRITDTQAIDLPAVETRAVRRA